MNIYDIAQLAGVSIATVSRVINDKPGVSEQAKEKVLKAIEENNFIPNQLAKSLANKKSFVIGLVMPGINNYYSHRVDAINKVCKEHGYSLMITSNYRDSNSIEDDIGNFNLLIEKRVDGIIYFPTHVSHTHIELLKRIETTIPIVITDSDIEELNSPCIVQNSIDATKEVMDYLIEGGHKRIGFINGLSYDQVNTNRVIAYKSSLELNGLDFDLAKFVEGNYTFLSGYQCMETLLERNLKLTAVYAANDKMAIGAMKKIQEMGLSIPEDISIVGYDGIEFGGFVTPTLSTIKINQYKLGEIAANLLMEYIESRHLVDKRVVMDYEFIKGGSSCALRGGYHE